MTSKLLIFVDYYLSVLGLSWGGSSGQALPSILFLASAYSASRWARDLTCGVGLLWFKGDPSDPLLAGRFRMRIWGGGAAGRVSSCITIVVFNGDREELLLDSLEADRQEAVHAKLVIRQIERGNYIKERGALPIIA